MIFFSFSGFGSFGSSLLVSSGAHSHGVHGSLLRFLPYPATHICSGLRIFNFLSPSWFSISWNFSATSFSSDTWHSSVRDTWNPPRFDTWNSFQFFGHVFNLFLSDTCHPSVHDTSSCHVIFGRLFYVKYSCTTSKLPNAKIGASPKNNQIFSKVHG